MQKKRILIVSYYFAPQNLIGAVRPTKMAKYLQRMGHEVTVICGAGRDGKVDPTLQRDLQELKDVRLLTEWNPLRAWYMRKAQAPAASAAAPAAAEAPAKPSALKKLLARAIDAVYVWLRWQSDRSFSRMGRRELKKLTGTYDAVFSSYAPFSVHEIARKAKASGLARFWIADFRDEVGMPFGYQEGRKQRYMRMLRSQADVLSAVSQGFLEMMDFQDVGRVLSNGYDREDIPEEDTLEVDKDRLRVVYCGQLRDSRREVGDRDITPMFRALRALADEGVIRQEEIRLVYAGREGELLRDYAARSGLQACVEDHGQVSREQSIALQKSADILLMASHHMASQRGILTGKLFEYMMMDKPIVCCMAGDLPNSGVKQVLLETGMGVCCEAAGGPAEEDALRDELRGLITRWRANETLLPHKHTEAVDAYSYPNLAAELMRWIDKAY